MFETLQPKPADAILGLIAEFREDPRPEKIDLGVGVFRTAEGETPVLDVVKRAEQRILDTQDSKAYIGTAGDPQFNAGIEAGVSLQLKVRRSGFGYPGRAPAGGINSLAGEQLAGTPCVTVGALDELAVLAVLLGCRVGTRGRINRRCVVRVLKALGHRVIFGQLRKILSLCPVGGNDESASSGSS